MKPTRRILAVLLCLLLTLSSLNIALSEDTISAAPEIVAAQEPEAKPAQEAEASQQPEQEPEPELPPEPEADANAEPDDAAPDTSGEAPEAASEPEITAAPSIDYTQSAAHSPNFVKGYARLIGESLAYAGPAPSAKTVYSLRSGVVYVLSRSATAQADRLEAAFDGGDGERIVWIDASRLRPMSPKEAEAFVQARAAAKDARFLSASASLPLDALNYVSAVTYDLSVTDAPAPAMLVPQVSFTLGVGEALAIPVSFSDDEAHRITYTSDDPAIAAVSDAGVVTPKRAGETDIRLQSEFGNPASVHITVLDAPASVSLAETEVTIGVGEKMDMPALTFGASDGDGGESCTFESSNNKIASVSADGVIKGVKKGSATITVTSYNGETAALTVNVKAAPTKAALSAPYNTLGVGDSVQLSVKLTSAAAVSRKLTFSSSKASVATVDASGKVTAVAPGTTKITVKTFNGKKGTLKITVKKAPESVSLDGEGLVLGVEQTAKLTATLSAGSAGSCTFTSSNPGVLTVDAASGALKAVATGSANITVKTHNGKTAVRAVTVKAAPSAVSFAADTLTIGVGEKVNVPGITLGAPGEDCAGSYTLKTSQKKVATVSADGVIKGVKKGSATITVTTYNGKTATLAVTVKKAPTKVTLSAPHKTLGVGEEITLTAKPSSGAASSKLTYTSSNTAVASVDASGKVTALATGKAKITVKTFNKKKASVTLTVVAAPTGVSLPKTLALGVGESYTAAAALSPAGSGGGLTYTIDNTSVATVNASTGAIKAVATGSATLRVKTYNGYEATCALSVKAAPTGITLQDGNFTLSVGDTRALLPPVLAGADAASGAITYKSSAKTYAKVSAAGVVTAVKAGSAKITVSTYNGKKATLKVTVKAAPKSISFSESAHRLFIGDSFAPAVSFANGVAGSYTLTSSNPAVAVVEGTAVRGVAAGTVTLTATSFNKKTATMTVTVPALPDSVTLSPASLSLGTGDSAKLTAVMPSGQGAALTYENSNPAVVSFAQVDNENITVSAVAAGDATITVCSSNGRTATAQIAVRKAPTAVSVSPSSAGRSISEKQLQLSVGFGGADEGGSVTFTSSDTSIATVSASGLVTFVKVGTVRITVTTYNGHSATCTLTIGEQPTKMSFDKSEYLVALGDSVQLPASFDNGCESYTLSSGDSSVASVSGDMVTGVKLGSTTLTATSRSGLTASCAVRVVAAPTGVKLDTTQATLVAGTNSTLQLHATPLADGVGSVTFSSSAPEIAAVDSATGLVTARKAGDCVICATTYNGFTAECAVHVSFLLEGVKIGIDPGHQSKANTAKEAVSPSGGEKKYKVSGGTTGVSTRIAEYKTVLQIGLKLRDTLEALGAEVYMTRETNNVDISNQERAALMNKYGVDLVLRLHCNAASNSSANGVQVYIRKTCAYSNSVVNGSTLLANENAAAKAVYNQFAKATGCAKSGIYKTDTYTMNNWSKVPCLLLEMGFSTNPTEDKNMNNADYQDKMVRGMVNGICEYVGRDLPTEW